MDGAVVRDAEAAAGKRLFAALLHRVRLERVERHLVAQAEPIAKHRRARIAVWVVDGAVHAGAQGFRACFSTIARRRDSAESPRRSKSSNIRSEDFDGASPST